MKKLLCMVLALSIIISTCVTLGITAFAQNGGDSETKTVPTAEDGTLTVQDIESVINAGKGTINLNGGEDLKTFAKYANTNQAAAGETAVYPDFAGITVQLNADVTVNGTLDPSTPPSDLSGLTKWASIVNFAGTFNGGNHFIDGLYLTNNNSRLGFFDTLTGQARIQDLTLRDCYTSVSNIRVAVLARKIAEGGNITIDNVHVDNCSVTMTNSGYASGIVASVAGKLLLENSTVNGKINSSSPSANNANLRAAGVICYVEGTGEVTIRGCTNNAAVSGSYIAGGLVAISSGKLTVENSINNGNVSAGSTKQTSNAYAGGILGHLDTTGSVPKMEDVTNNGEVKATNDSSKDTARAGGLIAVAEHPITLMKNCENKGAIEANGVYVGGLIGALKGDATIESSHNSGTVKNTKSYAGGLLGMATKTISLTGCRNANTVSATSGKAGGLVAHVYSADANVTLSGCINETQGIVTAASHIGGIVGVAELGCVTIENSINKSTVSGKNQTGGFVGQGYKPKYIVINNCVNMGNVSTTISAGTGGFVGHIESGTGNTDGYVLVMSNSANYGSVTAVNLTGGLLGRSTSKPIYMENCLNAGNVTTSDKSARTGGLVGSLADVISSTFKYCLSVGAVDNTSADDSYTAAFVGDLNGANTTNDPLVSGYKCFVFEECYFVSGIANGSQAKDMAYALANLNEAGEQSGNVRLVYGDKTVDMIGGVVNDGITWNFAVQAYNLPVTNGTVPTKLSSADAMKGIDGLKLLTKAGFSFGDEWHMTENGPVPTALAVGDKKTPDESLAICYKGYQMSKDGTSIRFVAGMNEIDGYSATGFDAIITVGGVDMAPPAPLTTKTVYKSLTADGVVGAIKASDHKCEYLSALEISNIPTEDTIIELTATLTTVYGEVVKGTTIAIVIKNGNVVAQYAI